MYSFFFCTFKDWLHLVEIVLNCMGFTHCVLILCRLKTRFSRFYYQSYTILFSSSWVSSQTYGLANSDLFLLLVNAWISYSREINMVFAHVRWINLLFMYLGVNIMKKRNFVVRSCYNTGIEFFPRFMVVTFSTLDGDSLVMLSSTMILN